MNSLQALGQHGLIGLEIVGTAAFALSGVIQAMQKKMDMVGVCVCGFLAAFGGGTLRDVLIDRRPFFWVEQQSMLIGVLVLCVVCASLLRQHHLDQSRKLLLVPDAIGLGLFSATGVHLAWSLGLPPIVAVLMGVVTATFGGVLRDLAGNEIPRLFRDHRPYAVCALAGGVVYAGLSALHLPDPLPISACAVITVALRILSVWRNWTLPALRLH